MWFWIKNLLLAVILITVAIILITDQGSSVLLQFAKDSQPAPQKTVVKTKTSVTPEQSDGAFASTTTEAGKGLSSFYGKIKEDLLGNGKTIGDGFVLKVDRPTQSVDEQLQNRALMVNPGSPNWQGETEDRHFRTGETIREILSNYAEKEGIVLIWRLERDYIIKHYFQVESNFVGALGSVAKALDSDFERDVFAYYCPRERAAIITYDTSSYLTNNCKLAQGPKKIN